MLEPQPKYNEVATGFNQQVAELILIRKKCISSTTCELFKIALMKPSVFCQCNIFDVQQTLQKHPSKYRTISKSSLTLANRKYRLKTNPEEMFGLFKSPKKRDLKLCKLRAVKFHANLQLEAETPRITNQVDTNHRSKPHLQLVQGKISGQQVCTHDCKHPLVTGAYS